MIETFKTDIAKALKATGFITKKDLIFVYPQKTQGDLGLVLFGMSKKTGISIAELGPKLIPLLKEVEGVKMVVLEGGYLNIFIKERYLLDLLVNQDLTQGPNVGKGHKTVVEFCSPNANKPLHLGHLRNICFSNTLSKVLEYAGYEVIKTNVLNDRGVAVMKSALVYDLFHKDETPNQKSDHYVGDLYVEYEHKFKENETLEEVRGFLVRWEAGNTHEKEVWQKVRDWAVEGQRITYQKLGVSFDEEVFESDIYKTGKELVVKGLDKKVFVKDSQEGYVFADLSKEGLPNKIVLRSDGTALYITQDLALFGYRYTNPDSKCFGMQNLYYVTALEQNLYFAQLFSIVRKLYDLDKKEFGLRHIGYGMVRLPDGRMKSREGTVVDADDLIVEIENLVRQGYFVESNLSEEEISMRVDTIAKVAYTFYLTVVSTKKDMVFDAQESIKLQGKSGPYILYTYARIKSIFRKVGVDFEAKLDLSDIVYEDISLLEEKELLLKLNQFYEIIKRSIEEVEISLLVEYLYELSDLTNQYYHKVSILHSKDAEQKLRLKMLGYVAEILKTGLGLMNVTPLEEM
jgi:arginyl-tRNA synthetase